MTGCQVTGKEKKQNASNLLKLAIELGDTELCQNVVKESVGIGNRNLDCGGVDCGGVTPVNHALVLGQLEIAECLILKGASVAEPGDTSCLRRWTPFHHAALQGHVQILRVLFGKAPQEILHCCQPLHPIHLAIANGHTKCVQLIIDHARKGRTAFSTFQNHLTEKL